MTATTAGTRAAGEPVADRATERETLARAIRELAVVPGRVRLASGRDVDYYVDLRRVTLSGRYAPLVGRAMLDLVADLRETPGVDAVGGLTMGADPVATAMLHAASAAGQSLDAAVVRKSTKDHGLQRRVEGPDVAGRRVVAVEDTSTTGGSVLVAVEALREAGAEVLAVAVLVDRATEAADRIRAAGLEYRAVFGLADLGLTPAGS